MLNVYAVWDVKSKLFSNPFFMTRDGQAIRAFSDLANNKETTVGRYPGDYELVYLGSWDENNGLFVNENQKPLGFGSDFKEK